VFADTPFDPGAVDPREAERSRAARDVRLNTIEVPRLRLLGFTFVAVGVALHDAFVLPRLGLWGSLVAAAVFEAYCVLSWLALRRFYARLRPFDLGLVFLVADLGVLTYAIYATGGDQSWIFFILGCRVADQTHRSVRRALAFAHLVPLSYALMLGYLVAVDGRAIAPLTEVTKLVSLYGVSLYIAITATIAEHRRRRMADAMRFSHEVIRQLREQSGQLDEARRRAESASEAKSQFLATMSHELRTPLNAIIGFSQILANKRHGALTPEQTTFVGSILTSGRHLLGVVNDVLDMARVEAGRIRLDRSEFDAAAALDEIVAGAVPMAREKSLDVVLRAEPRPVYVTADAARFRQIVINLLSNAIKFTPELGHVSITAVIVEANGHGDGRDRLRVAVADTGVGVKPDDHERIFQAFEQIDSSYARRQTGTGLGLALTRKLAELHGGRVWVESDGVAGKGSVFTLELPVTPG